MATKKTTTEAPAEVTTMTAKELAAERGTDPKSFRRFLRGLTEDRAGKGGRWAFDADTAEGIRKAWADRSAKGTTPALNNAD